MRVNSSPSSLIGLVASYHVSAQLPLREHPQKPRADVPTRALQEKVLLWEPLGMGGAPGVPAPPAAWRPSHGCSRGCSVLAPLPADRLRCVPHFVSLQKVQHFFS